ncbi:recQ4 helicase [Haemaphysalis longicornis]
MDFNENLHRLKVVIKEWEKTFSADNGRKPTSVDIKDAPKHIAEAYAGYWKIKKSVSEPTASVTSNDGVWDNSLNKAKPATTIQIRKRPCSTSVYSSKIRDKLLASFQVDSAIKPGSKLHENRSKSVQDELVCPKAGAPRDHTSPVAAYRSSCKEGQQDNRSRASENDTTAVEDGAPVSPHKVASTSCGLYYRHSLDESWLSRNSSVEDDEVFTPPSSSPSSSQLAPVHRPNRYINRFSEKAYVKTKVMSRASPHKCPSFDLTDDVFIKPAPPESPGVQQPGLLSPALRLFDIPCQEDNQNSKHLKEREASPLQEASTVNGGQNDVQKQSPSALKKETQAAGKAGKRVSLQDKYEFTGDDPVVGEACNSSEKPVVAKGPRQKCSKKRKKEVGTASSPAAPVNKRRKTGKQSKTSNDLGCEEQAEVTEALGQPSVTNERKVLLESCSSEQPRRTPKVSVGRRATSKSLNENFVRINLKRKKFSRGHHKVNVRKLKFQQWKDKRSHSFSGGSASSSKTTKCFKCGEVGHWARSCSMNTAKPEVLTEPEVIHLPTLEEAAKMAQGIKTQSVSESLTKVFSSPNTSDGLQDRPEDTRAEAGALSLAAHLRSNERVNVQPVVKAGQDGKLPDTPDFVFEALHKMGFSEFRPGQETAIMRILSGLSTLLVSSTGSGKSLCYQLPAYLYAQQTKCITLVVSPLISLMEDQVARLAPCLKAAFLHSAMPPAQKEQVLSQIRDGHVHFVLVSPESLVEGSSIVHQLPPVAFACIDEAHCLSEWSHNFRPSYLQLYKVLTTQLKVHCILALTATATRSTCLNIAEQLQIDNFSAGIIGTPSVPENLILSVSEDKYRDEALIELLKSKRLGSCESIIVYCTRREETERLASLIRTSLQHQEKQVDKDGAKVKNRRAYLAWDAEAYHAGMTPFRRRSVQKKFMTGKLRVVVATVAFGMGIDKADIRAIIHYNMPKSFENYVQEAGRAGRDGLTSHCHLFLEPEKKDQSELKRHIYANSVDRHIIRKLLKKVFAPLTQCKETEGDTGVSLNPGSMYEIAIPIDAAVEELDLKEENILTLLCFLEFHPRKVVQLLNRVYATCTLKCYGGPQQLRSVASKNAAVAAAMALQKKGSEQESTNTLTFPVVDVAARMGWDSKLVKSDLKRLEWDNSTLSTTGHSRKTGVIVEFSDLAFHLNVSASLTEEDCDDLLDYLHERVQKQEKMDLARLTRVHEAFQSVSCGEYAGCADTASPEKSNSLKKLIEDYFEETLDIEDTHDEPALTEQCLSSLRQEIRSLVFQHRDHSFNGRAVARIFHGIGSPCFPAQVWGRVHRFWRSFLDVDFNTILNVANKELLSLR